MSDPNLDAVIIRRRASGAAERANYQLFLSDLCDLLVVERPQPATSDPTADAYVFEKPVPLAQRDNAAGEKTVRQRAGGILRALVNEQAGEGGDNDD